VVAPLSPCDAICDDVKSPKPENKELRSAGKGSRTLEDLIWKSGPESRKKQLERTQQCGLSWAGGRRGGMLRGVLRGHREG
jgi:hypothetical protein